MGGSDDASNIQKLTISEHAEAHLELYKTHGKHEDLIAYKALSGQISISEASHLAWILGSYKGGYALKPNTVPAYNKSYCYCVGCRKPTKPSALLKGHIRCFQKKFNLPKTPNSGYFKKGDTRCKMRAQENNSIATCPHCGKTLLLSCCTASSGRLPVDKH